MLKVICTLQGLGGVAILFMLPWLYASGTFDGLTMPAVALKISTSVVRAALLIICMVAAWKAPGRAAHLSLLALITFVVGASADLVFLYGFSGAYERLITTFYVTASVHAAATISIWLLAKGDDQRANG